MEIELVGKQIVDASVRVHKSLGPGLLESAYQACLAFELRQRNLQVACEVVQPIRYGSFLVDAGFRADMIVEDIVIIENKSVDMLLPIHQAQLLTYLRLREFRLGYLINWNERLIKNGIHRLVNNI